jgi:hypothetical protein
MYVTEQPDRLTIAERDRQAILAQIKAAGDVLWEWLGDGRDQNEPDSIIRAVAEEMLKAAAQAE